MRERERDGVKEGSIEEEREEDKKEKDGLRGKEREDQYQERQEEKVCTKTEGGVGWGWVRTEREDAERWNVGRKQRLTDGSIKIAAMLYYILLQLNI